jgi:hypothetical protein
MVGRAVAFNARKEPARRIGMHHTEVNAVLRDPDLRAHRPARAPQPLGDRHLEVTVVVVRADGPDRFAERDGAAGGEVNVVLEILYRLGRGSGEVDHRRVKAREDHDLGGRAGDRHVEPPLAALAVKRAEVH